MTLTMTPESQVRNVERRGFWTIRVRTNLTVILVGLVLASLTTALVYDALIELRPAPPTADLAAWSSGLSRIGSLWLAGLAVAMLIAYIVLMPLYLRSIYRHMRLNNHAAVRLTQGDTDLPPLPVHRRDEFGQMARALTRLRDLTDELRRKTLTDPLTGLANREALEAALDTALDAARERVGTVALVLLDLKRFRHLNHAYGIETGDRALQHTALCLRKSLPQAQGAARLQADRFGLVLALPDGLVEAQRAATAAVQKLCEQLGTAFEIDGHRLTLEARVGVALFPNDGSDVRNLMIAAEAALALARRDGGETLRFANPELAQMSQRTANTVAEIRQGLLAGQFVPHYEPIVDLGSGQIRGAEALARWSHPKRGLVSPAEFIPVAEDMGMIESLTSALLPLICADAAAWNAVGDPSGISVNLSARELNEGFVARLAEAIAQSGLDPRRVTVELTETAMVEHPDQALEVLRAIKALGVTLSLDDFGTGFSSLSYLQRFPIDNVKIDRSFVSELPHSERARQLVGAILSMARALNLDVVAEGVETIEQANMLAEMGCLKQQGYLYARALSAEGLSGRLVQINSQLGRMGHLSQPQLAG